MKVVSSFTRVIPNLHYVISSEEHKTRYYETCIIFSIQLKSAVTKTVTSIFRNTHFHFWVNYHFNENENELY